MGYSELLSFILKTRSKKECQATLRRWIEITYEKFKGKGELKTKQTLEEFAKLQQSNLGYMAGYYDAKSAARILEKANLRHPIFGGPQEMKNMTGIDRTLTLGMVAAKKMLARQKEA
jgi:hypothetical protein